MEVELSGFNELETSEMAQIQAIVDKHAEKIERRGGSYLKLTMKRVHEQPHSEKFEIHGLARVNGKQAVSKVTDRDLIGAVDATLEKLLREIGKL